MKKEYGSAATTKPGMHKKAPAKRIPMSKARASTAETSKTSEEVVEEGKKMKERVKKTTARVLGRSSIMKDPEEEGKEEDAAPAPKSQKLMGDAIKSGAATSKPESLLPKLKLRNPQSPRETPEVYLLRKTTRPQCLKLKKRKLIPLF